MGLRDSQEKLVNAPRTSWAVCFLDLQAMDAALTRAASIKRRKSV
jgi:hypothetical protein